jgi:ribosomal protein S21
VFVVAHPGEGFEELLLRFRRGMERAGILRGARRRRRFVPRPERRRERIRRVLRRRKRAA